jgi:hypothetical protein
MQVCVKKKIEKKSIKIISLIRKDYIREFLAFSRSGVMVTLSYRLMGYKVTVAVC